MKNQNIYLGISFLVSLSTGFMLPIYSIFLLAKGLTLFQIGLVNLMFYLGLFVFEIPTGVIADTWGRKISVVISCLVLAGGMYCYSIASNIWLCLLAELLGAIGNTFSNGALQAWFVDGNKEIDQKKLQKVFSFEQVVGKVAYIIGANVGSLIYCLDSSWPWLFSCVSFLITCMFCLFCIQEKGFQNKGRTIKESYKKAIDTLWTSLYFCKTNKPFRFLLLIGLIQFFAVMAPNMQWQPMYNKNIPSSYMGVMFTSISIFLIIGSYFSNYQLKLLKGNIKWALVLCQVGIGFGLLCAGWFGFGLSIAAFMFHEIGRGMFKPLQDNYLNQNISSEQRATLISFQSMAHHVGGAIGLIISGWLAQQYSINLAWIFSGLVLILLTLLIKNGKKR